MDGGHDDSGRLSPPAVDEEAGGLGMGESGSETLLPRTGRRQWLVRYVSSAYNDVCVTRQAILGSPHHLQYQLGGTCGPSSAAKRHQEGDFPRTKYVTLGLHYSSPFSSLYALDHVCSIDLPRLVEQVRSSDDIVHGVLRRQVSRTRHDPLVGPLTAYMSIY